MPFQSKAQVRYMYAKHPQVAKRWEDKYGISKHIPEHKGKVSAIATELKRRVK